MKFLPITVAVMLISAISSHSSAQVTNVRSGIESTARVSLSVVDESDLDETSDEQLNSTDILGPITSTANINSAQGNYTSTTSCSASFLNNEEFSFQSTASYQGFRGSGNIQAQSFGHTLSSEFQYDFMIPADGTLDINGTLFNSGPSSISFVAIVNVFAEFTPGSGFTGAFFSEIITDAEFDSEVISLSIPLNRPSGSYRVEIRLSHSGVGPLDTDLESGSLTTNFTINAENPCPADLNGDETLDFFDISAFLTAFSANDPLADINGDGVYDFFDISAFLGLFTAGC